MFFSGFRSSSPIATGTAPLRIPLREMAAERAEEITRKIKPVSGMSVGSPVQVKVTRNKMTAKAPAAAGAE